MNSAFKNILPVYSTLSSKQIVKNFFS